MLAAATPDRRDVPGLVKGLARASELDGSRDQLVASLLEGQRRKTINVKDRLLLLALAERDSVLPDSLLRELDELLVHCDPTDTAQLTHLALVYQASGNAERARQVFKWVVACDLRYGYTRSLLADRLERVDHYLASLPEQERGPKRGRVLAYLDATPLDTALGEVEAALLKRWMASEDAVGLEHRVETLRQQMLADMPSEPELWPLAAAIARYDAASGRFDKFVATTSRALDLLDTSQSLSAAINCDDLLPKASEVDDPLPYARAVASAIEAGRANGAVTRAGATRSLCLLGRWCAKAGLTDLAASLLRRVEEGAGDLGEHWLWIADLARLTGAEANAVEIEARLLEERALPVLRIPALLEAVQSSEGPEAAGRLAVQVAEYSDHPEVLRHAIAYCRGRGDRTALQAYQDRLRATTPTENLVENAADQ
jgi:hypothetical protein